MLNNVERKSIYNDFETLRTLDIDVIQEQQGKTFTYHVASRQFELAELKLLVDAIQSSKFITEKKSKQLIKKLQKQTAKFQNSVISILQMKAKLHQKMSV
mgnify:CR=1 FL=1